MTFEEEYSDVLQNIETAIVTAYEDDPKLLDLDVMEALDGLIRAYQCEEDGVRRGEPKLSSPARRVFALSRSMCEWRLGRAPLNPDDAAGDRRSVGEVSLGEVVLCLKRIRKSVSLWYKQGGRQGYLDYVRGFLGDAGRVRE